MSKPITRLFDSHTSALAAVDSKAKPAASAGSLDMLVIFVPVLRRIVTVSSASGRRHSSLESGHEHHAQPRLYIRRQTRFS